MNAREPMTMYKGMMPKMENSTEFTAAMSKPMMPMMSRNGTNMNLGRDKLHWSQEIWNRIDQAAHAECQCTKIARKFLPLYGPVAPGELTMPSDTVLRDGQTLAVDEAFIEGCRSESCNSDH